MEILAFIGIVIVVGFFIIPSKKRKAGWENLTAHAARPENCTCKNWTRWSFTLDYNCPVHGDWR